MLQVDKVTIADTALCHLKGLPVGRKCVVVQVYELYSEYKIFEVFDPGRGKTCLITEDMVARLHGPVAA